VIIDTHCHLTDRAAFPDVTAVLEACRAARVGPVITVGIQPEDWTAALALAEAHAEVYAIVGVHPNHAREWHPDLLPRLRQYLAHPKVVALGEIGLDFHWDFATPEEQLAALTPQLDLAVDLGKPVVFHARKAMGSLLDLLEARDPHPYLFHCYSGDAAEADRVMALGGIIGVDGPVTYPKADDLRAVIQHIGLARLVLETDSPYLTPVPHRGKPNSPVYLPFIAQELAQLFAVTTEEVITVTSANARQFFRLPA
jgi:TatD DNase family protein